MTTTLIHLESPTRSDRAGLGQILRAEVTKLFSLRSTYWTLLVTVLGTLGVTVLSVTSATHQSAEWYQGFDPTNQALTGLALGSLALGVLGILAITGEFGTGMIRSTLAATPRRGHLLAAKVIVVGVLTLIVGEVLSFSSFWLGQALLHSGGAPSASLGQPGVLRAVALSGAFLSLLSLLGLGLGVIIRHTVGAIASFVGVTFLITVLFQRMPGHPAKFTPEMILANSVASTMYNPEQLSATVGFVLMIVYTVVVLGAGAWLLVRRDP